MMAILKEAADLVFSNEQHFQVNGHTGTYTALLPVGMFLTF